MNSFRNPPSIGFAATLRRTSRAVLSIFLQTFWTGPKLMITSRIHTRTAGFMIAAAIPALLCTLVLTVPAMIYSQPDANAYYLFGQILQNDPASWIPVIIAGLCSLAALAVPSSRPALPFLSAYQEN